MIEKMLRRSHLYALALLAGLSIALLAGCGGGDDDAATGANGTVAANEGGEAGGSGGNVSSKRSSAGGSDAGADVKADAKFIAKADAICREASADIEQSLEPYAKSGPRRISKNAKAIVDELVNPNLELEIRRISGLRPFAKPTEEEEALLSAIGEMIIQAQNDPQDFLLNGDVVVESEEVAKEQGFAVCGGI